MGDRKLNTEPKRILPCSLFVEGRACLVVGGGKIGERKAGHLLDAGADVTVVAPEAGDGLAGLADAGRLRLVSREFAESDVDGMLLAFAATDDEAVNRRVLEACRAKGVLACSAGASWPDGDFATPAILRKEGLVVTVATGGASCRRARRVKDAIGRQVELLDNDDEAAGNEDE